MPNMKIVQFSDANETTIVAVFSSPQDPEVYSYLGEVEDTDARYISFISSFPPVI